MTAQTNAVRVVRCDFRRAHPCAKTKRGKNVILKHHVSGAQEERTPPARGRCRERTTSRQVGWVRLRQIFDYTDAHGGCVGRDRYSSGELALHAKRSWLQTARVARVPAKDGGHNRMSGQFENCGHKSGFASPTGQLKATRTACRPRAGVYPQTGNRRRSGPSTSHSGSL